MCASPWLLCFECVTLAATAQPPTHRQQQLKQRGRGTVPTHVVAMLPPPALPMGRSAVHARLPPPFSPSAATATGLRVHVSMCLMARHHRYRTPTNPTQKARLKWQKKRNRSMLAPPLLLMGWSAMTASSCSIRYMMTICAAIATSSRRFSAKEGQAKASACILAKSLCDEF